MSCPMDHMSCPLPLPVLVLVDSAGYPKLADFGCASHITERRQLPVGTPSYMSPQARAGAGGGAGDW